MRTRTKIILTITSLIVIAGFLLVFSGDIQRQNKRSINKAYLQRISVEKIEIATKL